MGCIANIVCYEASINITKYNTHFLIQTNNDSTSNELGKFKNQGLKLGR